MALLIYPRQIRWYLQPPSSLLLDRSHPLVSALRPELVVTTNLGLASPDLVRNQTATSQGNPTFAVVPFIGQALKCDGSGDNLEYNDRPTTMTGRDITLAMVCRYTGPLDSRRALGTSSTTNAGFHIEREEIGTVLALTKGGVVVISSSITWAANTAVFVGASYRDSDGLCNFILRDLSSFALSTATATNTQTPINGDGIYNVGGGTVFSADMFEGEIGLAVIAERFVSLNFLAEWSLDPYALLLPLAPRRLWPIEAVVAAAEIPAARPAWNYRLHA